jgi:HEPN domain-containing protein
MARKRRPPNDPREWLNRAQSNLARAQKPLAGAYLEDFCFDAQQAAEKAVKAVFIAHGLTFPYIHDLGRLLVPESRLSGSAQLNCLNASQREVNI